MTTGNKNVTLYVTPLKTQARTPKSLLTQVERQKALSPDSEVKAVGFEPTTYGLKVRCSTS